MLKETETEETIGFFVVFLPSIGGEPPGPSFSPPPATPMAAIAIYISLSSL